MNFLGNVGKTPTLHPCHVRSAYQLRLISPWLLKKKNSALSQYLLLGQSVTRSHSQSSITSSSKPQPRVHKLITTCLSAILWARHQIHQSPFDGEVSQQTIAKLISFTVPIMMNHFFFFTVPSSRGPSEKPGRQDTRHGTWPTVSTAARFCTSLRYNFALPHTLTQSPSESRVQREKSIKQRPLAFPRSSPKYRLTVSIYLFLLQPISVENQPYVLFRD